MSQGIISVIVIFSLIAFFGIIIFGVIMIKRHTNWFKKNDDKPSESQIVKEELNRVLEEVKDESTIKAMADYEEEQQKKDKQEQNPNNK